MLQGNTPPDQTFVTGDIHYHSHENHYHDEYPSISFAVEQKCEKYFMQYLHVFAYYRVT